MLKPIFFMALVWLASYPIYAQVIEEEENIYNDDIEPAKGPNSRIFRHFLAGFGMVVDQPNGNREIQYASSNSIDLGYRYKYKLSNLFSAGWGINYSRLKFSYDPIEVPIESGEMIEPEKDFLRLHQLKPSIYFRVNVDPNRKNDAMGKFIDVGAYGAYNFGRNKYYEFDNDNAKKQKVIYSGLEKVEKFSYGLLARLGSNKLIIYGQFRLSDLLSEDDQQDMEPSRIVVGLEVGLYK